MSKIEWTDETWNPVTGCSRVSPGCANCYMFALYPRLKGMKVPGYERAPDVVTLAERQLDKPHRWRRPRRIFVNSMSDLFHESVPFGYIDRVFDVMADTRRHQYQVLTKRPERARQYARHWVWKHDADELPPNVWLGVSVESQQYASRVGCLQDIPAAVRFVSAEPLLEAVSFKTHFERGGIDWVIVGGESGRKARPMDIEWARKIRDECQRYGVAFFFKQFGGRRGKGGGTEAVLDGQLHHELPIMR